MVPSPPLRSIASFVTTVLVLGACTGATAPRTSTATRLPASLALVNGMVIDGTGADAVSDGVVVIDGDRIVAVGPRGEIAIPPDTPTVDVYGAAVLPGFINAHVHEAYNEEHLEAWAHSGVTTVRDLGAWIDDGTTPLPPDVAEACRAGSFVCGTADELFGFRDEAARDPALARLVAAGPIIGLPRERSRPLQVIVDSPEEARGTVNALVDVGADLIKIYISEPTTAAESTQDAATAIVDTAHTRGVPVAAHVMWAVHLPYALEAGVDDLVHMVRDKLADDLVTRVIDADVYWVPTLELWDCVSTPIVAVDNLRRFAQAGGRVALGTDYNGADCDWELGMPMTELDLMLEADMTPMQIIVAATSNGAHVCGLEDQIGTLEAGKIADILVVAGNPLDDIQALTDVQMVVHGGVVIRDEFTATE